MRCRLVVPGMMWWPGITIEVVTSLFGQLITVSGRKNMAKEVIKFKQV